MAKTPKPVAVDYLDPRKIDIPPRQRKDLGDLTELKASIQQHSILNPIIVRKDGKETLLIAGHRRLQCALDLGLPEIPIRFFNSLSSLEITIIELDENIQRKNLTWQEECLAVLSLHEAYVELNGGNWTQEDTAEKSGYSAPYVSKNLAAGRALETGDEQISKAASVSGARNILDRRHARAVDSGLQLMEEIERKESKPSSHSEPEVLPFEVKCQDFVAWLETYSGPRFNFIHCDFPYGVGMHTSDQGGGERWDSYEDTPEIYYALLSVFCEHLDKFAHASCHVMFWFSMSYYQRTVVELRAAGLKVDPFPLLWHKSDNKGILPDPKRGPRRTYETALFCSRDDRPVVMPVANSYSAPTSKSYHMSEKPEPVLRHFFRMFVDHTTTILDPTCGSGTALNVASQMGAERVLGMDINEEHVNASRRKVIAGRNIETLRKASGESPMDPGA